MNNHTLQQMTLENIARACGGTYVGEDTLRGSEITGAVIDSRQVEPGYLYIPIRGERVDGHRFIPDVFEKGALAVLSEEPLENPAGPYILVASSEQALKDIAEFYRSTLAIKIIPRTSFRKCWTMKKPEAYKLPALFYLIPPRLYKLPPLPWKIP